MSKSCDCKKTLNEKKRIPIEKQIQNQETKRKKKKEKEGLPWWHSG